MLCYIAVTLLKNTESLSCTVIGLSLTMNITAKANDTNDILQTFR